MIRLPICCLAIVVMASMVQAQAPAAGGKAPTPADRADDEVRRLLLRLAPTPLPHPGSIASVTFSPDGKTVTTVCNAAATVYQWDSASGKLLREWRLPQNWIAASAVGAGGKLLAAADEVGRVALWDTTSGKRLHSLKGTAGLALAMSPDGRSVIAGLPNGQLAVWDTASGKERCLLPRSAWSAGLVMAFSPDGSRIAAARPDGTIGIWDSGSGKELRSLPSRTGSLRMLAFGPDNTNLASCDRGGLIRVWSLATGRQRRQVQLPAGHTLTCGFFTPDGRALLTGGVDGTIRLWEVASGRERHCFPDLPRGIVGAALAVDGRSVATAGGDNVVLVRAVGPDAPAEGRLTPPARPRDLQAAWDDLAHPEAARAYQAVAVLASRQAKTVEFLKEKLRPAAPVVQAEVVRLIADLNNPKFAVRQKAMTRLQGLPEGVEDALEAALRGNLPLEARKRVEQVLGRLKREGLPPAQLQSLRALEALELIGTTEARALLRTLASGAPGDPLTEEARAVLHRLRKAPGRLR
jgi:WD40 repeat protein